MIANGPWKFQIDDDESGDNFRVEDANGGTVLGGCGCCNSPYVRGDKPDDIARLINASPELLEMCERLYLFAYAYADKSAINAGHGFLEAAKDLIDKVKGKQDD